jgi:hypothetical protein
LGVLGVRVQVVLRIRNAAPLRFEAPALTAGEVRDLGEMHFEPGRTLVARVVDAEGEPVPGAGVAGSEREGQAETTDSKGEATLSHVPRYRSFVAVTAKDHARYSFAVPAEAPGPLVFRLEAEGVLEVRALERDGAPAPTAQITLKWAEEDPYNDDNEALTERARADGRGIWQGRVQARAYRLRVLTASGDGEGKATAVVRSGETTTVTVRLP